jgi:hypothetical protein
LQRHSSQTLAKCKILLIYQQSQRNICFEQREK